MTAPSRVPPVETIARVIIEGFDRHYRIFREASRTARALFERGDRNGIAQLVTDRIDFYDLRVAECVQRLEDELPAEALDYAHWGEVKREYIGRLTSHLRPELAETFFNSVSCRILNRSYYKNDLIFVRPSISTEYLESEPPTYRCYYPNRSGIKAAAEEIIRDLELESPFEDLHRDLRDLLRMVRSLVPRPLRFEADHQIQVLGSLFFRGEAAYLIGKAINGGRELPFALPIRRKASGHLYIDALLLGSDQLAVFFSATRAYFLVDMEVPAAYVAFLRSLMPSKPKWELYTIIGLQKAGKNLFYRDFLHHLEHSRDPLSCAPGTKGLVMVVFTLPSFPYVFKVIRDRPAPPKSVSRQTVRAKYRLVKHHDRVGRMADTLEYSDVAFPLDRFAPDLLEDLKRLVPSQISIEDHTVFIGHLYMERRLAPLNLYLESASEAQIDHVIDEYGRTLEDLAATNIFPGDLLLKNFGVTRLARVVFYDYDEIDYLTECRFRDMPTPRDDEEELAGEPWFAVDPKDIFPEELATFIFASRRVRERARHRFPHLFEAKWWRAAQTRIESGDACVPLPYSEAIRFENLFPRRKKAP